MIVALARAAVAAAAPRRPAGGPGRARKGDFAAAFVDRHCPRRAAGERRRFDGVAGPPRRAALRETIRQRVEAAGTSFYWAMRLLPRERRDGMYAVYAWCREVDDIADGDRPRRAKLAALAAWRDEIEALYAGRPRQLVARALQRAGRAIPAAPEDFLDVIDGMEMDAREDIRAPDLATLDLYCARVAGAVGHLSVHVFGDRARPRTASPTRSVARCSSPTSCATSTRMRGAAGFICRAKCSTVTAFAARAGGGAAPPRAAGGVPRSRGDRRPAFRASADAAMARCSRRAMRPAAVMGAFYRAMLDAMLRGGWRDPAARVGLSKPRKLWLVLRHGLV